MTGNTTPTTFITRAAGLIGGLLLLGLPLVGAQAHATDSIRTVDVTLSRYAFSPERIEVRLGERVRLNVVSVDTAHGFQVKELGLNVRRDRFDEDERRDFRIRVCPLPDEIGEPTTRARTKGALVVG
jgi:uncharacterized cupredoxin-like copper-binding protein